MDRGSLGEDGLPLKVAQGFRYRRSKRDLDSVLATAQGSLFGAGIAGAVDDEPMVFDSETVRSGDLITQTNDLVAGEFDQLPAFGAV
jgi:putative intracellular protease/amidase